MGCAFDSCSNKMNKVIPATDKNLASLDGATGVPEDSGITPAIGVSQFTLAGGTGTARTLTVDETSAMSAKADKVSGATAGNLASFVAGGGLEDAFKTATELTIDGGSVAATGRVHTIDTAADGASDDLDTITGGAAGNLLLIRAEHTDRTVVIKHGTGNIYTGGSDIDLDDTTKFLLFYYDGELSKWVVVGGSGSGGGGATEVIKTMTGNLSAAEVTNTIINNYGQAADVTLTLPTAAANMEFTVICGTTVANYLRLDPGADDQIYLDGVAAGNGKYVGLANVAIGDAITFVAFQTGAAAYDWKATTIQGAWGAEA